MFACQNQSDLDSHSKVITYVLFRNAAWTGGDTMKTIEVTDEVFAWLAFYKDRTPSETIKWWHDEVFSTRMSSISDSDFGR